MAQVLLTNCVRSAIHSVVADRQCEALRKARELGLRTVLFDEPSVDEFCERLVLYLSENSVDYVLSFYTDFYTENVRERYRDRIINFHPSLLPAFKGMDGFGDGIEYHTKIIGTTVELIKDVMDEGKIVMQSACTVDPRLGRDELRHRIFVQQCKTLIQVVCWILENRLYVEGDCVTIRDAHYSDLEFVPALERQEALELQVPFGTNS